MCIRLCYVSGTNTVPYVSCICLVKSREHSFFYPQGGQVGQKKFHPDRIGFCESLNPLYVGLTKTCTADMASKDLFDLMCPFFNVVSGTGSIFPHK